jgi:tetratricopeptide (TPR) repeat protein
VEGLHARHRPCRGPVAVERRGRACRRLQDLHQLASDYAIVACTNLIEGGKLDKREQAIAYVQRALADLNRAIELDSGLAPIYANRGQLVKAYANRGASYLRKGDVDGALADFDRAIELQPQAPEALAGRAQANLKKGLAAKALPDVEQALSNSIRTTRSRTTRGRTSWRRSAAARKPLPNTGRRSPSSPICKRACRA